MDKLVWLPGHKEHTVVVILNINRMMTNRFGQVLISKSLKNIWYLNMENQYVEPYSY